MKYSAIFLMTLGIVFSNAVFAQSNDKTPMETAAIDDRVIIAYRVQETINMNFGSSIRTYEVTSLDMITPKDIGKNNVRKVTPRYAKVKAKAINATDIQKATTTDDAIVASIPTNTVIIPPVVKEKTFVDIDVVETYERIMDKGYKTVDMIIKVADKNFFEGNMDTAAKWYLELFNATTEPETIYYYRYGQSLIATGQTEKGNEMLSLFKTKSL
ncbi:hypothetical protein ACSVH2_07450 [Flavobacterium sp. RSB2_4_14]|uniref:hypothetical protein n=1 Tax=Flavobacterium sp. RSB2_4_14 TaxID=3447665 RepID=UPI003F2CEE81